AYRRATDRRGSRRATRPAALRRRQTSPGQLKESPTLQNSPLADRPAVRRSYLLASRPPLRGGARHQPPEPIVRSNCSPHANRSAPNVTLESFFFLGFLGP